MTDRDLIARASALYQHPTMNWRDFTDGEHDIYLEEADAILAALAAAGRVIVPKEPTYEQSLAGLTAGGKTDTLRDIYCAMIAAGANNA